MFVVVVVAVVVVVVQCMLVGGVYSPSIQILTLF